MSASKHEKSMGSAGDKANVSPIASPAKASPTAGGVTPAGVPLTNRRYLAELIDSRNRWILSAISWAQSGDIDKAEKCAMRACRRHARSVFERVR